MRLLYRSLAIILICMSASVSAAEDDLDALRRRVAEIEAEQAKSQETIKALLSAIETLRAETEDRLAEEAPTLLSEIRAHVGAEASVPTTPGPAPHSMFPELANESQFVLRSADEEFSLGIDGTFIFRGEYNHRSDDGTGSSSSDQGWENIATRLNLRGRVYGDFGYWIRLQADEFGRDPFFDAVLGLWFINENTTLVVGQFPSLLTREQGIPADKLVFGESSATNYTFDPFGFKGVMLGYHTPRFVYRGIIHDGYGSISNAYFEEPSADWAFAGQVLGMAVGDEDDWERFNNFTSRPGSDFAWQLNGSFLLQDGASDSSGGGSDDVFLGIVESSMEGDGWHLYASGYYRDTDESSGIGPSDFKDFGWVIQGGVWVSTHFEVYSRFDMTIPDDDRLLEGDEFRTLTTGLNYYPLPHTDNIRLSTEFLYMFDAEADSIVEPNIFNSVRESPDGNQWVIRSQASVRW